VTRRRLPTGTVTLLFTDIEGSTRLLQELGDGYGVVLEEHRRLLRDAFQRHGGVEVDTQGDAFFFVFGKATDAIAASRDGQTALTAGPVRVRIGIHTGEPVLASEGYVGIDVHRAARICSAAHGGQTVLSDATARLVDADLRDLGEQRLKDLDAPLRLYQLGHDDFPPLRTVGLSNLPTQVTALIGRERECDEVSELLQEHRLVTLVGPGGSGKTRLALQVAAAAIDEFKDGVFWVPLAPVRDPALVEPTIAKVVGTSGGLAAHLANRQALLVLDNFEHLIDAARGLGELLGATTALKLLITSREPLQLSGEWEYAVPPLPQNDAIALFIERARALQTDFEPDAAVAEVCRRLDGLPLAIELAAARIKVLAPQQLLDRLGRRLDVLTAGTRDVPMRQRTLRATIDWSYELLAPAEQDLFMQLAVFMGGWTLDAAEAVADAGIDTLESLAVKSLIGRDADRFGMLETLREYALERLDASGQGERLRDRHARFFLELVEMGHPEVERGEQAKWASRLGAEHDNLRVALQRFIDVGDAEFEERLVAAVWKFWFDQGLWEESGRAIERALALTSGVTPSRAAVLQGAAWIVWRRGGGRSGIGFAEQSVELSRALGDPRQIAASLRILGVHFMSDDPERAAALFQESIDFCESSGDRIGLTAALNNLAIIATQSGDHRRAADGLERAVSIARQSGNPRGASIYTMNLAHSERELGEYAQARTHFTESLSAARSLGIREVVTENLYGVAVLADLVGDHGWAGALVGAAQREGDFGHVFDLDADRVALENVLSSVEKHLGKDGLAKSIAAGRAMTLDAIVEYLEGNATGAPTQTATEEPERALALVERLDTLRMDGFVVVGHCARFDEDVRNTLEDARQNIVAGIERPGHKRNAHLIWAAPGSGKTFFVEQVAASLPGVAYGDINLAKCSEDELRAFFGDLEADANERRLCFVDECDARPGESWPYEVLLPSLDAAASGGSRVVFVFAGSSGSTLEEMKERMAGRPKGADLLSRIPNANQYRIAPMSTGDRILISVGHLTSAAREAGSDLRAVEKMALYYIALDPRLGSARQLREFALRAVERLQPGEDRLKYDHLFTRGDPENKAFWIQWRPYHRALVNRFVAIANYTAA
jgi:predicted ATPase/class 3 adenylate cyclase